MQSRAAKRSEPAPFAAFATFAPPLADPSPTDFDDTETPRLQATSGDATSFDSRTRISKPPVLSALVFRSCLIDRLKAAQRSPLEFVRFSVVTTMGITVEHGSGTAAARGSSSAGRDTEEEVVVAATVGMAVGGDVDFPPFLQLANAPNATTNAAPNALIRIATNRC